MKLTKSIVVNLYLVLSMISAQAQHQELSEPPKTWNQTHHTKNQGINSLLQAFTHGRVSGHFRYFFMATDNEFPLTDYYANAAGGGLKFETAQFHHFQAGISGFYIFNIGSSDFTKPDSLSTLFNRYEVALFDIEDPGNISDMDRLEELYLRYHYKNAHFTFGKQLINTPFINLQDSRMRPTGVEGLWGVISNEKKIKIEGGYLYGISPRSTLAFYDVGESIGIYPSGVDVDGSKSNYRNNLNSKGILIAGLTSRHIKNTKLQIWNQFVENIFNTTMIQADYQHDHQNSQFIIGLQSIFQTAVHQGGNNEINKAYFSPQMRSFTYGAKAGWNHKNAETSINYNRITAMGRYLMPREWGRDPFYTFLPRERNEGLGDVHAMTLKVNYSVPSVRMNVNAGVGYYDFPSVKNFKLNKYGMPSYAQITLDLRYEFAGMLKGFDAQLLVAHKMNASNAAIEYKNIMNRVDMTNVSAVVNFRY